MTVILGIESSCDETAIAIVTEQKTILSHALISQHREHAAYGGVVPEIAARSHLTHIDGLYRRALQEANCTLKDISAIAVTAGPGLIGGVMVGVMFAKALAASAKKPLIAVNHLEGHALTVRLTHEVAFPYFLLLVSGGHCQMLMVHGVGDYELLGTTRDDALGEAFDKCAKLLGLPYPGGPAIEQAARRGNAKRYPLPMPMQGAPHHDFSFSGLKTAVRLLVEKEVAKEGNLSERVIADVAASFQHTVIGILKERLSGALREAAVRTPFTALAVAGGVAANEAIRDGLLALASDYSVPLVVAPAALCTDNAAMIAWAGIERFRLGFTDTLNFEPKARWPLAAERRTA